MMDIFRFSSRYLVRRLGDGDIEDIFALCRKNELYYKYCPPFVTRRDL